MMCIFKRLFHVSPLRILAAVFLLFLSCTPTYIIVKLDKNQLAASRLAVLPFYNCTINFPGSVEKMFGKGGKDSLIVRFLQETIAARLVKTSGFHSVSVCDRPVGAVEEDSVKVNNGCIGILRPAGKFSCAGGVPDFVLFVYNVAVDSGTVEYKERDVVFSETNLEFSAEYVYMKAESKEIVSYGKIQKNYTSLFPAVNRKSFKKLAEKISDELLVEGHYSKN